MTHSMRGFPSFARDWSRVAGLQAAFGAVIFAALRADGAALEPRLNPPSSTKPVPSMATVHVRHSHSVVQKCMLQEHAADLRCTPTLGKGDPRTELRLIPRRPRSVRPSEDKREPVAIVIRGGTAEGAASADIAPGRWELDWAGYPSQKTMSLASRSEAEVTLQTVTGRCDRISRACSLVAGTVSKRLDVVVR